MAHVTKIEPESLSALRKIVIENCGWEPGTFSVAVEALILNDAGEMLFLERGPLARDENGKLEGVGGQVEHEDLRTELVREVTEEIGTSVRLGSIRFIELKSDFVTDTKKRWAIASYVCEHTSGTPRAQEPGKIEAIHWMNPLTVASERMTSSCRQSVASLTSYLAQQTK